ncbi:PAS domain S-box-containing protein [Desulfocicer vacuolatum DSM 3385]|uniref:histidine kinase n=1 Tax=Desulfocicer vacuolatum DSM 3385 TaxID=1121400 RepID=A0A1W2EBK5_9BACT|nr:ATP-binding protein [Desulfocicer vacuolatum]SMD07081.1 PAS domain S-box-containing protein [Desulfocicer vacuolatum DSM 3385]
MNYFNQLSLKNKIFISCLGIILLVSFFIALFTRSLLITGLTGELKKRGIGIAQGVADSARVYMLTKNRAELTAIAYDAKLGNRKDIIKYLMISDNRGNILAHTFTTGFPPNIETLVKNQNIETANITGAEVNGHLFFHVVVPVKEGIYTIGSVQAGLNKRHIERLISDLRLLFLSFLSMVSIIFFFLSHRLALHITKPISSLIRYTDQITRGNFNIFFEDNRIKTHWKPGARNDEITKLTNSFIKMTSRLKVSTNRLKESQKKYHALFRSGPNPIFVVKEKTFDILDANPNAMEMLGYERRELLRMNLFSIGNLNEIDFIHKYPDHDTMVISSKVKFFKKNGEFIFVNIHANPSEYRNKKVLIVAATDITELVEKDSQLIQASKMTNLEKMSAGIAHEINQPLNAIKMGSEYLCMMKEKKQTVKDDDLDMVLSQISSQVTRAAEIVGRLKTFSRKANFSREVIQINNCVRAVNKIIGRQITLQNIDLVMDLTPLLPTVLAHNNRMEQVIFNLVTNAKDAINERIEDRNDIEKGIITITTFFDDDIVGISIADNGTGIDPGQVDLIFDSFYTTKEMGEGMGLGLSIIQGIIKDYNGTICVGSTPGHGAIFKITFPAHVQKTGEMKAKRNI